nr:MAG TPA: hypothetical protein [Caudoviricetes sp.]DAW52312.1 MAG TPA: hypothetical protein [Caudoviricetes sp.]
MFPCIAYNFVIFIFYFHIIPFYKLNILNLQHL